MGVGALDENPLRRQARAGRDALSYGLGLAPIQQAKIGGNQRDPSAFWPLGGQTEGPCKEWIVHGLGPPEPRSIPHELHSGKRRDFDTGGARQNWACHRFHYRSLIGATRQHLWLWRARSGEERG